MIGPLQYKRNQCDMMTTQTSPAATRLSLLARARQRDQQAWRELVDLYGPLMKHWCLRCGLDEHSAADCVQEAFAAVSISIHTYRPSGSGHAFRNWLWTVTRNKVRDQLRKAAKQPRAFGGETAQLHWNRLADDASILEDEPSDADQLSQLLQRGLRQVQSEFETRSWQAFVRTAIDGQRTDIVAQELNLSPAAVRQCRSRILRRLKQQLGDVE